MATLFSGIETYTYYIGLCCEYFFRFAISTTDSSTALLQYSIAEPLRAKDFAQGLYTITASGEG